MRPSGALGPALALCAALWAVPPALVPPALLAQEEPCPAARDSGAAAPSAAASASADSSPRPGRARTAGEEEGEEGSREDGVERAGAGDAADAGDERRARCAALARADSIRHAMRRPPGSRPHGLGWYVAAPLRLAVGALGYLVLGGLVTTDQALQLAEHTEETYAVRPGLTSIGYRSSLAGELEFRPLEPFFARAAYSIRGSQRYAAGIDFGDVDALAEDLVTDIPAHAGLRLMGRYESHAQPHFWGIGPATVPATRSDFGWERIEAVAFGRVRSAHLGVEAELAYENNRIVRGGDDARPDLQDVFGAGLFGAAERTRYARAGVSVILDGTSWHGMQPRGGALRVGTTAYMGVSRPARGFHRVYADGLARLPVNHRLRLQFEAHAEMTRGEWVDRIPFFHLAAIGGDVGPRGFSSRRFRDLDAAVLKSEWVYEIWRDEPAVMEGIAFFDLGAVAPRLDRLSSPETSYGLGIRVLKSRELTLFTYVGFSRERTRFDLGFEREF